MKKNTVHNYLKENNLLDAVYEAIFLKSRERIDLGLDYEFGLDKVVAALDIGYGNTKFSYFDKSGNLVKNLFPSLTPSAPSFEMSSQIFEKRETKTVEVNTVKYEVGYDVEKVDNGSDTNRNLNEQYVVSDKYHALFLGALSYINLPKIDCLVMGLPVKYMYHAEHIIKKFTGEHILADNVKCEVKEIIVIPQPLGAFYNFAIMKNMFSKLFYDTNLIIDPGFLTLDFLCMNGLNPIENRSDAMSGGMSSILSVIAKSITAKRKKHYDDFNAIDKALRGTGGSSRGNSRRRGAENRNADGSEEKVKNNSRYVVIAGENVDLVEHIKQTTPVIESAITYLQNKVKTFDDISNIMLSGGASKVFEKKIKEAVSERNIITSDDPVFDNVVGFLFYGLISVLLVDLMEKLNNGEL